MKRKKTLHTIGTTNIEAYDVRDALEVDPLFVMLLYIDAGSNIIVSGVTDKRRIFIFRVANAANVDTYRSDAVVVRGDIQ